MLYFIYLFILKVLLLFVLLLSFISIGILIFIKRLCDTINIDFDFPIFILLNSSTTYAESRPEVF